MLVHKTSLGGLCQTSGAAYTALDMAPLLQAVSLTKHYGSTVALEAATFDVHEGVTGLLGPNGAGKSTAIKLFLGLIRPTSGFAEVLGTKPYESLEGRTRLGYMPEHECLPPNVPAAEFLMHMAQVSGLPPAHARTRAADILRHVGLDEERYRPIGEYSTGMRQRVKLAQALVHDPVLVLLDEPTAGLDPGGREEMLDLIKRTGQNFGISIMLSTHLMGDIERTADRVIVLENGRVAQEGAVSGYTKETETLLLELHDKHDEVVASLASRGVTAVRRDAQLVIEEVDDAKYDAVRDALAGTKARLRRMAPERGTLTDIFRDRSDGV
jgi:ABC-2 type transport system ATP-binding protein